MTSYAMVEFEAWKSYLFLIFLLMARRDRAIIGAQIECDIAQIARPRILGYKSGVQGLCRRDGDLAPRRRRNPPGNSQASGTA